MTDQLTDLVLGFAELGDIADDPPVFGGQVILRGSGYAGGDGGPGTISRLKPQLPVVETVPIAELIQLMRELLSRRLLEEGRECFSDEVFRVGAKELAGGDVRVAYSAV